MRKYSQPAAHARRSAGITADYLEAVEAESDYEDDGLTASDRARRSLLSRDRLDEQAEVRAVFGSNAPAHMSTAVYIRLQTAEMFNGVNAGQLICLGVDMSDNMHANKA